MPTQINPIEALAAITGIGLVTGERKAAITQDEVDRATKLGPKVAEMITSAIGDSLDCRVPPPINTKRAIATLSKMADHADHVELIEKFPPGYRRLATGYTIFMNGIKDEVSKMLPRQVSATLTGPVVNPAPAYVMAKFLSVLQVIDDPLQVIRAIGSGTLLKKQAAAVKLVYPTLSELITTALVAAVVMKRASSPKWTPSWRLNNGMAAWFETTPIPQPMLQRLQEAHVRFAQRQAQQDAPLPPPEGKSPANKAQFDTPS